MQRPRGGVGGMRVWMIAGCVLGAPVEAIADAIVAGTVTSTGTPVEGAFVSIVGSTGQHAVITDASGAYSATVETGTYSVAASAQGYQVTTAAGVAVADTPVTQDLSLTASGSKFEALGVYGGQIGTVLADGASGVFYASTSVIPQLYRTADYGGTWAPVTLAADDPTNGLFGGTNFFNRDAVATSGFPGEIAGALDHKVYYSTDFGVTWRSIGGSVGMSTVLYWGHAGTTSVLLVGDGTGTAIQRADMTAPSPTLTTMTTSYLASANDRMAVGNSTDGSYVAVVSAAGTLTIYTLNATDDPPVAVGSPLASVLAQPSFVRLGGQRDTGVPPDAFLVFSSASDNAVMGTKSPGAASFQVGDLSTATSVAGCATQGGPVGAVSPLAAGASGDGTVAHCLLHKSGTGALGVTNVNGINNNTGLVFDAAYGGVGGGVIISGDGNRGLVKSAAVGTPSFPSGQDASAGTDPGSGGVAVHGFNVAVVKDTVFGPAGASQVGVILSMTGGALSLASDDAGVTFQTVVRKGGRAVDWWQGAANSWLVFGYGGGGDLLGAIADWTSAMPPLAGPNVPGSGNDAISIGPTFGVSALRGVPGTDVLFVGTSDNDVGEQGMAGTLVRAALTAGSPPAIGGITALAAGQLNAGVQALGYCPSAGSAPTLADVLLVATGTEVAPTQTGSVVRIADATGASPAATVVSSIPATPVNDLRVHCGSGTVYAGTGTGAGGPHGAFYKSVDGGTTFTEVAIAAPGVPPSLNVQVVAVNPDDADEVLVAGNGEGFILHTADGGTTWTVVNDPMHGRNFLSEGVGDLEIPPATSPLVTGATGADATARRAVVGTGGGLYAASLLAATVPCTTAAQCDEGDACTNDTCTAGRCVRTQPSGFAGADCELRQLGMADVCGGEALDKKLRTLLKKSVKGLRAVVAKAGKNAASQKKLKKLLKKADRLATKLEEKSSKSKASADCKARIAARMALTRAILDGVARGAAS